MNVWTLLDRSRVGEVIARGDTVHDVIAAYQQAVDADPADEGNLYLESPDGDQFTWDKQTKHWEKL